jgi:Flp pilus assembly protein TadG
MPIILSFYRSTVGVLRQRRGAVMMMFAMALPVLTFAIGMGIDYARAMKAQTKMNAVADSAALSAVSKVAMRWPMPAKSSMRRRCRSSMPAISLSPT